jgi:subtilisin-like proprotein convertase family protein
MTTRIEHATALARVDDLRREAARARLAHPTRPWTRIATLLACVLVSLAAAATFATASASASESAVYTNDTPIRIPDAGQATPYPSAVDVQGRSGVITDVTVTLHRFSHEAPNDVDILLVSPDGDSSIVMSDTCGHEPVTNYTWIFADTASTPTSPTCDQLIYKPTDVAGAFPDYFGADAPPGPYTATFSNFLGGNPNGTWRLYVIDRGFNHSGEIANGWSLVLNTVTADAVMPRDRTSLGIANPYPITRTVSGVDGVITDLNVGLGGVYHQRPADLDMMLVGPQGQKVVLMSDTCSEPAENQYWAFDDDAYSYMGTLTPCPDGRYVPNPQGEDESFPYPAPYLPLGTHTKLSDFDLTDPNGDWQLYVRDDDEFNGRDGLFTQRFTLDMQTRPRASVAFRRSAVSVTEGGTAKVTLLRSGADKLGAGSVRVVSAPLTATPRVDYKPVGTRVYFAAGETQKTITLQTLSDTVVEGPEKLALSINRPLGDAQRGTPAKEVVTINDPA